MEEEYLSWGNGQQHANGNYMRQREFNVVKNEFGSKIDNVYIKDDCILYIVKGELFKKGLLNFEKSEEYKEKNKDLNIETINLYGANGVLNALETVIDLAIGENHILIRTLKGNVYSWGDNYYGQLGTNNSFMAKVFEPLQIKVRNCQEIYAYKNSSFAIDGEGKLWVWGKSEFLGNEFQCNAFSPIQILSNYKISKLKFCDDRIIVVGSENSKNLDENKDEQNDIPDHLANNENTHLDEEKEDKKAKNTGDVVKMIIGNTMKTFIKLNSDIRNILNRLTISGGKNNEKKDEIAFEERILTNIREKVLSSQSTIKQIGLDQIWSEIVRLINNPQDNPKSRTLLKQDHLTQEESIDLLTMTFIGMINGSVSELNLNKLKDSFLANEKEIGKMIGDINLDNNDSEVIKELVEYIKILLVYLLKYKKIEMLIHKMSGHQFLLKSYHFENVLDGLQFVLNQDQSIDKKLYLIEKTFNNLKFLIEKTNESFKGLNEIYEQLCNFNYSVVNDNTVEKFMHKYIIESTFYIKDLWVLLIENVERHKKSTEKENQLYKILDTYKELNSIHMYLNTVSIVNIFKNDGRGINISNPILKKELKTRVILLITQIDGTITKIESIMKRQLEKVSDAFTNVFN